MIQVLGHPVYPYIEGNTVASLLRQESCFTWTSSTTDPHRCSQIATNHDSRRHANGTAIFGSRGLLQQAAGRTLTQPVQPHLQQKECGRWTDEGRTILTSYRQTGRQQVWNTCIIKSNCAEMWIQESTEAHTVRWIHYDALGWWNKEEMAEARGMHWVKEKSAHRVW